METILKREIRLYKALKFMEIKNNKLTDIIILYKNILKEYEGRIIKGN